MTLLPAGPVKSGLLFALCGLFSLSVLADTFYVDQAAGNDANDGTTLGTAVKTITQGITLLSEGDTLSIGPGVYSASAGEAFPLVVETGAELVGAGPDQTILDGEMNANVGVLDLSSTNASFRLTSLAVVNGARSIGAGVSVGPAAELVVHDCRIESNVAAIGGGIFLANVPLVTVTDSAFNLNEGSIGGAFQVQINTDIDVDMTITNTTFQGNMGIGSALRFEENGAGVHNLRVNRSSFSGNNNSTLAISGANGTSTVQVANSLFTGNTNIAVEAVNSTLDVVNSTFVGNNTAVQMGGNGTVVNTILWNNNFEIKGSGGSISYSLVQGLDIDGHNNDGSNLDADPVLNADFRLLAGSPAIDRGLDSAAQALGLTTDRDGEQRFYDYQGLGRPEGVIDMGADERTPLFADGFED